ncbi:MAG TPA: DUF5671 domain-containing protein [Bryobacteraceae bacterium]|nr:DUF5671 domain-containing protein [Bryobacteraceae bacterium]
MPPSDSLDTFVGAAKGKGASDEALVGLLRERGWPAKDIYAAVGRYYEQLTGITIPDRGGSRAEAARDAFLYLLAFSTLATWTIAVGALAFKLIDRWLPDPIAPQQYLSYRYDVSNQIASILVAFPIFLGVMRFILRDVESDPDKRQSGVRKWLTYIALLLTAGTMIGDLIAFLTTFLQGGLTVRFVLKALVVMIIAGSVFWYYLGSLKEGSRHGET